MFMDWITPLLGLLSSRDNTTISVPEEYTGAAARISRCKHHCYVNGHLVYQVSDKDARRVKRELEQQGIPYNSDK